ncbi:hypothetical protein QR680_006612 [Steinernema hermaphroditum]|uniref:Suppressor of forked domain-containing protein n=1 Tax=Steinernema hermaphroditum TaxID=289476 RepID=A0AA39LXQ2_9BILA|nr:hypothetical protein QR680_006612 [Steinernema hermaphroditum]
MIAPTGLITTTLARDSYRSLEAPHLRTPGLILLLLQFLQMLLPATVLPSHLWQTYINFELRYEEVDRARRVWQQFLAVHSHDIRLWIRIAYEQAIEFFHDELDASILVAFALFEERQKEHERARMIYKYDLEHLPSDKTAEVYKHYRAHEKK